MFAVFFLFLLALFTVWLASLRMLDRLIRLEYAYYAYYRERWEEDGRPTRLFFRPPEARALGGLVTRPGSLLASQSCHIAWLFRTPAWMRQDRRALRRVFWLRILTLVWSVGLVGLLAFLPYLIASQL